MDNSNNTNSKTANRVLLAAVMVFLFGAVAPFIAEATGIEAGFISPKLYFGMIVGAALLADRIYVHRWSGSR